MPSARLLTAAIPAAAAAGASAAALSGQSWGRWGVEAMPATTGSPTSFADLANITATAQCLIDGEPYEGCDPYGRAFQPYVVLPARILAAVGLGSDATGALGTLLAVVYVATVALLGWHVARAWRAGLPPLIASQVLLALLSVTAPAMLAIERGQIELITLALAAGALLLLSRPGRAGGVLGAALAVVAAVSKFFAIGLFAPFIRRGRPNWAALVGAGISAAVLLVSWSTLQQASAAARADLPATSKSQFGSATLVGTWLSPEPIGYLPDADVAADWDRIRLVGWILVVIAVAVATFLLRRRTVLDLDGQPTSGALVIGGAGILALPYVLGASHDYRQVFLLLVVAGALPWLSTRRSPTAAALLLIGATASLATGAAMVPTPEGFLWGKAALLAGDIGLLLVLAVAAGLWLRGLVVRRE